MSILTIRCRARMAAHTIQDQLTSVRAQMSPDDQIKIVERLINDRRKRQVGIAIERRDPTRKGFCVALDNDTEEDSI